MKRVFCTFMTLILLVSVQVSGEETDPVAVFNEMTVETLAENLNQPVGLCLGGEDEVYFTDMYNNQVKVIRKGEVTVVAGVRGNKDVMGFPVGALIDGQGDEAYFNRPRDLSVDMNGVIYVADTGNHSIRAIEDGMVTTLAGTGEAGYADGKGREAAFNTPSGLALGLDGKLYVADTMNNAIRVIDIESKDVVTLSLEEVENSNAHMLNEPSNLCFDEQGAMYLLDSGHQQVKMINGGMVTVLAGSREPLLADGYRSGGYSDGPAGEAEFNFPKGIEVHGGMVFVADTWNHTLRIIKPDGKVVTLVGNSIAGNDGSGRTSNALNGPSDIVIDATGKVYCTDRWNNAIKTIELKYGNELFDFSLLETGEEDPYMAPEDGGFNVVIGQDLLVFDDVAPILYEGRTYFPVRFISESLGGEVTYDDETRTARVLYNGRSAVFSIDEVPIIIREDRSMIPIRQLATALGFYVDWRNESRTVVIHPPAE